MVSTASVGQSKRDSRRNECCIKHQNPVYPTQLKPSVLVVPRRRQIVEIDSSSSSSSDDDNTDGDKESVVLVEQEENETETVEQVVVANGEMDWETLDLCREVARLKSELEKTKSDLTKANSAC